MPAPVAPSRRLPTAFLAALAVIALCKAWAILAYGQHWLGDNVYARGYAAAILAGSDWLVNAGEREQAIPVLLWRQPGYPLVLALAQKLFGDYSLWAVYVLQAVASLAAGLSLYRLMTAAGFPTLAAAGAFLLYGWATPMLTDMLLLPDGLSASLATIALCGLARFMLRAELPVGASAALGVVLAACFLLRDSYLPIAGLMAVVLAGHGWAAKQSLGRVAAATLAFVLPLIACFALISAWNQARTGHAIITSGGQSGYLYATLKIAKYDAAVFSQDTPLDRVARRVPLTDYDDADTGRINDELFREYGMTAPVLQQVMKEKLAWTMRHFPAATLASFREKLDIRRQAPLVGDPFLGMDELDSWAWASRRGAPDYMQDWRQTIQRFYETRDPRVLDTAAALRLAPRLLFRAIDTVLFAAFALGIPVLCWLRLRATAGAERRRWATMLTLWALYGGVVMVYLPFNVHARFLAPVNFIVVMGAMILASESASAVRHRWRLWRDARSG